MRIAFDVSPLNTEHNLRGIGGYTRNLLEGLKNQSGLEILEFTRLSEVDKVDIIHHPYFDLFKHSLSFQKKFPTVVTIHDVTPLKFPGAYPPGIKGYVKNFMQKISLKNVQGVITDSISSKGDIAYFLDFPEEKIRVVYLAVSDHFTMIKDQDKLSKTREKYSLPDEYALYIGSVNWNKNLVNMAYACRDAQIPLVFVGKDFEQRENLNHQELKSYKQFLDIFDKDPLMHIIGYLEQEDLVPCINAAQMVLLPSFYEGFGLPILEAQACGTPVITSNISSMPEVAGDGALLVNPYDVDDIKKNISNLKLDQKLQQQLREKGFKNVKRFSWEKVIKETIDVYKRIAL